MATRSIALPQVKPWSEIAKDFDPMMPAETYDTLRSQYFHAFVAPKVPKGKSVDATFAEFKKLTDRPALLTTSEKVRLHLEMGVGNTVQSMLEPLATVDKSGKMKEMLDIGKQRLVQNNVVAAREGMDTRAAQLVGQFTGQAADFALLEAALGPVTALPKALQTIRGMQTVSRAVRGGLAFGTLDALSAEQGNRLMSGVKGFAVGAAIDLSLGTAGYLKSRGVAATKEAAETLVGKINAGVKPTEIEDKAVFEKVTHDADVSRREMRPEKPFWQYSRQMKGSRVHVKDVNGREQLVELRPGNEAAAYKEIRGIIDQGGSISHYATHPDDTGSLNEFIRIVSAAEQGKYAGTVLRTPSGQAEEIAQTAAKEGMPATALTKDTVEVATVSVQHPILNKPEVTDIPHMPERRPSDVEVAQVLERKKGLDSKNREFIRYHFDKVWSPDLEYEEKRSSMVILGRHAPELLPDAVRAKMPPLDPQGNLIREVAQSRVDAAAAAALGHSVNVDHIGKSGKGKVVVTLTTNLSGNEVSQLQNVLGAEYEVYVPKKARLKSEMAKLRTDEEIKEWLDFHNVTPEEVDVEAIREGGEPELIRQLEVKRPELYGRRTAVPKAQASPILDKIPASEQREYRSVKDGVKSGGETHSLLQDAIDASGDKRFFGSPAGQKSIESQLGEASLNGRLMGSIEDVPADDVLKVGAALMTKGWKVIPLRGWESGKFELVYFRESDLGRVAPLINDYDNFISQQAGRIYNTDGKPILDVGESAHARLGKAFGIADKDIEPFQKDRIGGVRPAPEIRHKPYGNRLVLQHDDMQRIFPGAAGLATPSISQLAQDLGIDLPPSLAGSEPMIILTPEGDKATHWHERLHVNGMHAGTHDVFPDMVGEGYQRTALEIATGLRGAFDVYNKVPMKNIIEEAFTHAATAVRYMDKPYLEQMARWDTDIHHVIDFVHDTAMNLLRNIRGPLGDPPAVRIYQQTLYDLARRSSREVSEAIRQGIRATGSGLTGWYDHVSGMWVLKETPNREVHFKDISGLWDYLLERDKNFMAPSASLRAELGGVRGPIAPVGKEPDGSSLPLPEVPPEGHYSMLTGASAMWRPFFPWLATLHDEVNQLFRKSGKYWPGYETLKAVDDGERAGSMWREQTGTTLVDLLKPFKGQKMHSVFDYLTYPEAERTSDLMEKYGLTPADGQAAHKVWQFMQDFEKDTGIRLKQYMLEYHPKLRNFGWAPERAFGPITTPQSASYWDKLIRHDMKWDPQDAHLGKFLHVAMVEGMEKKFTGKALAAAEKLIGTKATDGTYVIPQRLRWPLENYTRYMRGIPDTSQQIINKAIGGFTDRLNVKLKDAGLPLIISPPRQIMNRFMLASYVMGLGGRPALALRDAFQAFTGGMVVLGPARFMKGFTRFMGSPRAALDFADNAGALLRKNNAGELLGDITQEIPSVGPGWMDRIARWSNALLAPSRWGHNFSRAVTFTTEYQDALEAVNAYRAGGQTVDQLMESTSMHFMDRPASSNLLRYVADVHVPAEDAARKIALETVDLTQWPYRRGTQPAALTYGAGRIFGQYGVWPSNYADFLYRIGRKWSERPQMAARMSATWVAVNYAASHSMEALGADTSKWFWQSPAGFAGSPHWDFVHAAMVAPENTDEGRAARKTMLEYPLNFVPALSEMKSVAKAIEEGGMDEWPPSQSGVLRALGFKPLADIQRDQSWSDFVETQLGFKNARRRP